MTPKQEAALRQALEFIKQVDYPPYDDKPVIAAIDEALAEPKEKYQYGTPLLDAMTGKTEQPANVAAVNTSLERVDKTAKNVHEQPAQQQELVANREDLIRMAREAGMPPVEITSDKPVLYPVPDAIQRFAALVAAHVRETEFKPDWNKYQQGLADGAAAERAEVERLKLLCEEMLRELYVYRASEYLKDVTASIRARIKK